MPVNPLKITRQWIEKSCHGKWDLVETILTKEKLLQYTTKALSWELQSLLEMTPDEFPAVSFYKWVQRYRKKYTVKSMSIQNKGKEYGVVGNRNKDDWKNFQLTDPSTLKKADAEPLLVKVIPNKKNITHTDENILF